mmetsp:Transcript_51778/g.110082  ORF Transcript_51778/g.110082 Transcript_51778/m.110082 type:complete len:214 (-) Transcript_51778:72-713(-)
MQPVCGMICHKVHSPSGVDGPRRIGHQLPPLPHDMLCVPILGRFPVYKVRVLFQPLLNFRYVAPKTGIEKSRTAQNPRELVDVRLIAHSPPALRGYHLALGIEDHELGNSAHTVPHRELLLPVSTPERKGQPGHLAVILLKRALVLVAADEHNFKFFPGSFQGGVFLGELRRESAAGRTPVRAEVEANRFGLQGLQRGDSAGSSRSEERVAEE